MVNVGEQKLKWVNKAECALKGLTCWCSWFSQQNIHYTLSLTFSQPRHLSSLSTFGTFSCGRRRRRRRFLDIVQGPNSHGIIMSFVLSILISFPFIFKLCSFYNSWFTFILSPTAFGPFFFSFFFLCMNVSSLSQAHMLWEARCIHLQHDILFFVLLYTPNKILHILSLTCLIDIHHNPKYTPLQRVSLTKLKRRKNK